MTMIYILAALAVVVVLLMLVAYLNTISETKFNYSFFTWGNLLYTTLSYALIYLGKRWYLNELAIKGDILNGQIVIAIGLIMIGGLLYQHIKNTTIVFGLAVGVIQLVLYLPAAFLSIIAFFMVLAWLSDTKPVVNLN